MVSGVENYFGDLNNENIEQLPEDFDPTAVIEEPVSPVVGAKSEDKDKGRLCLGKTCTPCAWPSRSLMPTMRLLERGRLIWLAS